MLAEQNLSKEETPNHPKTAKAPVFNHELVSWLEVATYGLSSSEKPRIRADIEEHFHATLEAYQKAGIYHDQASAKALADLGSPSLANQKYQTVYLTISDDARISSLKKPSWWAKILVYVVPIAVGVMIIFPKTEPSTVFDFYEQWSLLFWLSVAKEILFWFGYLFEGKIKLALLRKFPTHGIFLAQLFVIGLAVPFLDEIMNSITQFFAAPRIFNWTGLMVMICSLFWLKAQLPLTIKAIRRLRT